MNRRFGCFSLLIPLILIVIGYDNIRLSADDSARAARYTHVEVLTIEQFLQHRPQEGWFRITGGFLDLSDAGATKIGIIDPNLGGTTANVFAPLRSLKAPEKAPRIVVDTFDRETCSAWAKLEDVDKGTDTDFPATGDKSAAGRILAFARKHPEQVFLKRDVEGIVLAGADRTVRPGSIGTPKDMADDYIELQEGLTGAGYKKNDATRGILMVAAALLYWGFRIVRWLLPKFSKQPGQSRG